MRDRQREEWLVRRHLWRQDFRGAPHRLGVTLAVLVLLVLTMALLLWVAS